MDVQSLLAERRFADFKRWAPFRGKWEELMESYPDVDEALFEDLFQEAARYVQEKALGLVEYVGLEITEDLFLALFINNSQDDTDGSIRRRERERFRQRLRDNPALIQRGLVERGAGEYPRENGQGLTSVLLLVGPVSALQAAWQVYEETRKESWSLHHPALLS